MSVTLGLSEYIAIASVIATALGAIATWFVMRRQFASKRLTYFYKIEPMIKSNDPDLSRDLKIYFKGEELPEPVLLSINITNTGLAAVENAEVVIQLPGATYLIPGHFIDMPAGYSSLWDIERTDAEECTLKFQHINPKQTAQVRLLMDEMPKGEPRISCPMPNVELVRGSEVTLSLVAEFVVSTVAPQLIRLKV